MAPTLFDSCDWPEVKETLGSSASPAGDERRRLLQAKEESKNDVRWRRSMVQQARELSAMLQQQQERLTHVVAKASEQVSESTAALKLEREKHMPEVDVVLAEKQTAQEEFKTRGADLRQRLDDKENMMAEVNMLAEVLKQASDCEERLEKQWRAFEQQLESAAAENAKLQQQLNRMGEDSSAREQMIAEVLKQARDGEERLEDQRRAFEDQVEKTAAENAELQQQLSRMGEELQRRLERLHEHCGKEQAGNEQLQKQTEQLRQDHVREQDQQRDLPKDRASSRR